MKKGDSECLYSAKERYSSLHSVLGICLVPLSFTRLINAQMTHFITQTHVEKEVDLQCLIYVRMYTISLDDVLFRTYYCLFLAVISCSLVLFT